MHKIIPAIIVLLAACVLGGCVNASVSSSEGRSSETVAPDPASDPRSIGDLQRENAQLRASLGKLEDENRNWQSKIDQQRNELRLLHAKLDQVEDQRDSAKKASKSKD